MDHVPYNVFLMGYEYTQSNHRLLLYSPLADISTQYVRQSSESILHP